MAEETQLLEAYRIQTRAGGSLSNYWRVPLVSYNNPYVLVPTQFSGGESKTYEWVIPYRYTSSGEQIPDSNRLAALLQVTFQHGDSINITWETRNTAIPADYVFYSYSATGAGSNSIVLYAVLMEKLKLTVKNNAATQQTFSMVVSFPEQ